MKIFVSWSGKRSKAVAELISDWLKCVIQASQPWISTRDIDRGAIWFSEISDKLKDVSVGVVCLTLENKEKPWILFETGALAKGLTTNRVCTFLIDLNPEDLQDPLAQFNHTMPDKGSVWELTRTINDCLAEKALDERILKQVFDTYWPQFDNNFKNALKENPPGEVVPPRSEQDILSEILANTRSLTHRIRDLESEVHLRPKHRLNNSSEFDKNLIIKILQMAESGKFTEDEIMSSLIDYDMPENYARDLIKKTLINRNPNGRSKIVNT
ncbi:toll-Interleukin receptor [Vibrio cholerae]|uniref:toll-Interleukin receptor n=1 Tax=Vibrio cholerae TaxID=666 RepID=UPI0015838E1A|nr:toll-Interleukin receptor [Vibrio cholerae]QKU90875.1 toll-Interleukin receptor [Vibrio cholerae]QKU90877.1 toll-Interleukin receptor [Vibrio cholerae]